MQRLKFSFNNGDIGVDQVVEQAGLIWAQLLAALGKFEAIEQRELVGPLLFGRLVIVDLLVHRLDALHQLRRQGAQFFRVQIVEICSEVLPPILPERATGDTD